MKHTLKATHRGLSLNSQRMRERLSAGHLKYQLDQSKPQVLEDADPKCSADSFYLLEVKLPSFQGRSRGHGGDEEENESHSA